MLPRVIPQDVKNKVYEVTQDVFEQYGRVETEKVRAALEEDYGICFFNTIELEKLIKEGLDKQIFAYKDKRNTKENHVCKTFSFKEPKKQGIFIQLKSCVQSNEEIEEAIEVLREKMNSSIEKNGRESNSTLELSQKLDILIVASMRNSL